MKEYQDLIIADAPVAYFKLDDIADSPIGAHRYWRIYITLNNGDAIYSSIKEIELRETEGGVDATGSGTAIASTFYSATYSPDTAFDNLTSTWWISAQTGEPPQWIGYDLAALNDYLANPKNILVDKIRFEASKEENSERTNRVSLYKRLVNKYAKDWNVRINDIGHHTEFILTR